MKTSKLFLDSGAFSLYQSHAKKGRDSLRRFFRSQEFKNYAAAYARFIRKHGEYIDLYANIDVLYDPELSWQNLKYLEGEFGLKPVPVIHYGSDLKWVDKHVAAGYDPIALGGMAVKVLHGMKPVISWLDEVFTRLCSPVTGLPAARVHGFGVTAHRIIVRYPWWSLDSHSWGMYGACGSILIPLRTAGEYDYSRPPTSVRVSLPGGQELGWDRRVVVERWLNHIDIPMGDADNKGVINFHRHRKLANIVYFQKLIDSLPDWPWSFTPKESVSLGGLL